MKVINQSPIMSPKNQEEGTEPSQKEKTSISISDFQIMKKLGQGAFGKVYLAKMKNKEYAIKKLSKEFLLRTQKVKSVIRERDILINNKNCTFLPKIYHSFMDEEYLYIVMEYIKNGTLQDLLKSKNEKSNLFNRNTKGFGREIVQFYGA